MAPDRPSTGSRKRRAISSTRYIEVKDPTPVCKSADHSHPDISADETVAVASSDSDQPTATTELGRDKAVQVLTADTAAMIKVATDCQDRVQDAMSTIMEAVRSSNFEAIPKMQQSLYANGRWFRACINEIVQMDLDLRELSGDSDENQKA